MMTCLNMSSCSKSLEHDASHYSARHSTTCPITSHPDAPWSSTTSHWDTHKRITARVSLNAKGTGGGGPSSQLFLSSHPPQSTGFMDMFILLNYVLQWFIMSILYTTFYYFITYIWQLDGVQRWAKKMGATPATPQPARQYGKEKYQVMSSGGLRAKSIWTRFAWGPGSFK